MVINTKMELAGTAQMFGCAGSVFLKLGCQQRTAVRKRRRNRCIGGGIPGMRKSFSFKKYKDYLYIAPAVLFITVFLSVRSSMRSG